MGWSLNSKKWDQEEDMNYFQKQVKTCNNMLTGEDRTKWKYADGVKILKEKDEVYL